MTTAKLARRCTGLLPTRTRPTCAVMCGADSPVETGFVAPCHRSGRACCRSAPGNSANAGYTEVVVGVLYMRVGDALPDCIRRATWNPGVGAGSRTRPVASPDMSREWPGFMCDGGQRRRRTPNSRCLGPVRPRHLCLSRSPAVPVSERHPMWRECTAAWCVSATALLQPYLTTTPVRAV